jgi:hypothetical protein
MYTLEFVLGSKKARSTICIFMIDVYTSLVLVKWNDVANNTLKYLPEFAACHIRDPLLHFHQGRCTALLRLYPFTVNATPSVLHLRPEGNMAHHLTPHSHRSLFRVMVSSLLASHRKRSIQS